MGIDKKEAIKIIDSFRPSHLWEKDKKKNWKLIKDLY
jgi:hypothetical protein